MKLDPDKFKLTTRFGKDIPIRHFTHAEYIVWGVASPLNSPYACELFRTHKHPILPFYLSGTRFVPSLGIPGPLQFPATSALSLFRHLKPFFRPL